MQMDEQLYHRSLDGDEQAATALVEKYGDWLTLYLNGYLKDIQLAEDIMIEAFSLLFAKRRSIYEQEGAFRAYLYKTARNLAFRQMKKRRLFTVSLEGYEFELQSDALAETELFRNERYRQLYSALSGIHADYREALYLVYFDELSYRDAGTVMGKSEAQITKLVYRGKQSLKAALEKEGFSYADN